MGQDVSPDMDRDEKTMEQTDTETDRVDTTEQESTEENTGEM